MSCWVDFYGKKMPSLESLRPLAEGAPKNEIHYRKLKNEIIELIKKNVDSQQWKTHKIEVLDDQKSLLGQRLKQNLQRIGMKVEEIALQENNSLKEYQEFMITLKGANEKGEEGYASEGWEEVDAERIRWIQWEKIRVHTKDLVKQIEIELNTKRTFAKTIINPKMEVIQIITALYQQNGWGVEWKPIEAGTEKLKGYTQCWLKIYCKLKDVGEPPPIKKIRME